MESEARTRAILVRMTQKEYDAVFEAGKLLSRPVTTLASHLMVAGANRILEAATVSIKDEVDESST